MQQTWSQGSNERFEPVPPSVKRGQMVHQQPAICIDWGILGYYSDWLRWIWQALLLSTPSKPAGLRKHWKFSALSCGRWTARPLSLSAALRSCVSDVLLDTVPQWHSLSSRSSMCQGKLRDSFCLRNTTNPTTLVRCRDGRDDRHFRLDHLLQHGLQKKKEHLVRHTSLHWPPIYLVSNPSSSKQ